MDCYKFERADLDGCEKRDVHPVLGEAIHAIADNRREPHKIWAAPTTEEVNRIKQAIREFIRRGLVEPAPRDLYVWGTDVLIMERRPTGYPDIVAA
jgi:hypothetical protein